MSKTEFLVRLRDLHEELSSINIDLDPSERVDEETIDALGQLATDVGQLVDQAKSQVESETPAVEHRDMLDRVNAFEAQHPRVTRFLSQMTDLLAMMGI